MILPPYFQWKNFFYFSPFVNTVRVTVTVKMDLDEIGIQHYAFWVRSFITSKSSYHACIFCWTVNYAVQKGSKYVQSFL